LESDGLRHKSSAGIRRRVSQIEKKKLKVYESEVERNKEKKKKDLQCASR
jgi:hypothetical protein